MAMDKCALSTKSILFHNYYYPSPFLKIEASITCSRRVPGGGHTESLGNMDVGIVYVKLLQNTARSKQLFPKVDWVTERLMVLVWILDRGLSVFRRG